LAAQQGRFTPMPPPGGPPVVHSAPQVPPAKKPDEPVWGIVAMACALGPLPLWLFEQTQDVGVLLTLFGAVVAIVFGSIGIARTRNADGKLGRGLAIAGLVIGIVVVSLAVLAIIFVFILAITVLTVCLSCLRDGGGSAVLLAAARGPDWRRRILAHHPAERAFEHDVFRCGAHALCVGCTVGLAAFFTTYATFRTVSVPVDWWILGTAGLALGTLQTASLLGFTRSKASKVIIKAGAGAGLGLALVAIQLAPWSLPVQAAAVGVLVAAIAGSGLVRARRLASRTDDRRQTSWAEAA
jgi:hypothetical protein